MQPPASAEEPRILVIDDTLSIHDDFRKILGPGTGTSPALLAASARLFGGAPPTSLVSRFRIDCVNQGRDGLECVQRALAEQQPYAIAFVDMRMPPGWNGIETIRRIWDVDPAVQIVLCTAYSDHTWEGTVAQLGPSDSLLILKKPFDNIEVLQLAHALARKWSIARRDRERMADLDERVRKRTSELREAEGRFTKVFNANPVPTTLQELVTGRYLDVNPAFLHLIGLPRPAVIDRTPDELQLWAGASLWAATCESLERGTPLRAHAAQLRSAPGAVRDVVVSVERVETGERTCVLTTLEDVTERLLLEKEFQQAQKMEAVGQLAAGIAHDFNNLLTVIQTYSATISQQENLGTENHESLAQIRAAADRAAALTRQLLVFSRAQISRPEPLDVGDTVRRVRDMLRRLLPEDITLDCTCAEKLPPIVADEADFEHVLMNLVINARDAMPRGGRISFVIAPVAVDEVEARRHPDARAGTFVQLTVADTGCGMTPEVMAHIFEPFFTTKDVGKGTGLGLSTVYGIVRQYHGWIEVTSAPGKGARFDLFLPAHHEVKVPRRPLADGTGVDALQGHGERILLVEDEPTVRRAARLIAARAGYDVTEAVDGPHARTIAAAAGPFRLLLTDMMMPNGCTGAELAVELTAQYPQLKVIIMTGYSDALLEDNGGTPPGSRLLLKPFTTTALLEAIAASLAESSASPTEPR